MKIVAFVEGGILQAVIDLDQPRPEKGVEYEVVDYDMFDGDADEDIASRFDGFSPELKAYMKRRLPDEYQQFQEAIERAKEKP